MKRRVIKHGPSTFIISLPTNWVKKYGINKGDELEVNENSKTLLVSTDTIRNNLEMSKNVYNLAPELMHPLLVVLYLKGYNRVLLKHNDINLLEKIQKQIPQLIGYEIVEQSDKDCLIQSISQRIELDFNNSLRRAFLILKNMIEECYNGYIKKDKYMLNNLHLKDLEVNRLCFFCLREINRENYELGDEQDPYMLYYLITTLERVGDGLKDLARKLFKVRKNNKDIANLLKLLIEYFELCYSYFYDPTKEKINREFSFYKLLKNTFEASLTKDLKREEILSLYLIKDTVYKMANFTRMRIDIIKEE